MRASVKSIDLIGFENWGFKPDDVENFSVYAEAMIGDESGIGADIFSFQICTLRWFETNKLTTPTIPRHIMFVRYYDEVTIKNYILDLVSQVSGKSWTDIASKLSRFMFWEFEDYREI